MSEDMWHIEMEPGDVKVVTLEQMDDMFRLDIIQASTMVWQEGMPRALPLSVVAGIDEEEEEEEIMEIEPELLDSAPFLHVPPPSSVAPPVISSPPPPRSTITPPPTASVVVSQAPPAPALPSPDFYSPQSLRPITMSGAPYPPAKTGTGGRIVTVLALAAGLAMTLYRNDVLLAAAQSAGSEAAYESVESTFGQPGFGTTRSVEELASLITPADAAAAMPTTLSASPTPASEANKPSDADTTTEPSQAPAPAAKEDKADQADKSKPAQSRTSTGAQPRKVLSRPSKTKAVKKFKGSEYDPMNASL